MYENEAVSAQDAPARIERLFKTMVAHRRTLVTILDLCADTMPVADVNAKIERMVADGGSTYSPAALTRQLRRAGALELVGDTGQLEPERTRLDGIEYLVPARRSPLAWRTTKAGYAAARSADAGMETDALLDAGRADGGLFRRLLERCAQGGAATEALQEIVDADKCDGEPKRYASHYTSKLKDAGALEWRGGSWIATQVGKAALDGER